MSVIQYGPAGLDDDSEASVMAGAMALLDTLIQRLLTGPVPADGSVTDIKVATGAGIAQSKIAGLVSALATLTANLAAEVTNRTADVNTEEAARITAVAAVVANLAAEVTNRAADVDAEEAARIAAVAAEASTRAAAVSTLTTNLATEVTNRAADVDAEEAARVAAVSTLTTNLATEATTRGAADAILTAGLAAELVARAADVDAEESARATAVSAEATTRAAAVSTLTTNLAAEVSNRAADVDAEETARIAAVAAEASARATAVSTEASTRAAADATLTTNLATEVTTRVADVDAEETARVAAVAAEASARATAVSTEATTRAAAVSTLTTNLATEVSRALAAESVLAGDFAGLDADVGIIDTALAAEVTNRGAADATLTTNLAAELVARALGDLRPANAQTTDYTLVLADAGKSVDLNAATAKNVTVPPNASVAFPIGALVEVAQAGAGAVTLVAGGGVTITGDTVTPGEGGSLLLRKTATNTWWSSIGALRAGMVITEGKPWWNVESVAELTSAITAAVGAGGGLVRVAVPIALGATAVTVPDTVDLWCAGRGRLTSTTTGVALTFDSQQAGCHSRVRLVRVTQQWGSGTDTTSIGVRLKNCEHATYDLAEVAQFETGVELRGDGAAGDAGTAYCTLRLGQIKNNRRNIRFSGVNGVGFGFANGNLCEGGAVRHDSGLGDYTGTRGIDLSAAGNGNQFVGINLEGGATEETVSIAESFNDFLGCRLEAVQLFHFLSTAAGNTVIGGYGNYGPGSDCFQDDSTSKANTIVGSRGMSITGDSASGTPANGGLASYEHRALTSNADVGYRTRRLDGSSGWEALSDGSSQGFAAGEAYPRFKVVVAGGPGGFMALLGGRGNIYPDAAFGRGSGNAPVWKSSCPIVTTVTDYASGAGVSVSPGAGEVHRVTLTADVGMAVGTGTEDSQRVIIEVLQDGTGGHVLSQVGTNVMWAGAVAPVVATGAGRISKWALSWNNALGKWVEEWRCLNIG